MSNIPYYFKMFINGNNCGENSVLSLNESVKLKTFINLMLVLKIIGQSNDFIELDGTV